MNLGGQGSPLHSAAVLAKRSCSAGRGWAQWEVMVRPGCGAAPAVRVAAGGCLGCGLRFSPAPRAVPAPHPHAELVSAQAYVAWCLWDADSSPAWARAVSLARGR
ncbi:hypothetical protein KIL84_011721 [Mauremys mutica]|uniref:Uncharacterized protein n=1 Tax=Mauremys mutica TaxID=74926 RepID=A0A9D4B298_9SAUR|nr:hypothetical protein KIL84_011721 [Mauremys mutica]